jgi:hypothetical protein
MIPVQAEHVETAKSRISEWLHALRVGGMNLPASNKEELLSQLHSARPVTRRDGTLEVVLPGLSALGIGIFQHSFRCDSLRVRVVPYGNS